MLCPRLGSSRWGSLVLPQPAAAWLQAHQVPWGFLPSQQVRLLSGVRVAQEACSWLVSVWQAPVRWEALLLRLQLLPQHPTLAGLFPVVAWRWLLE